MHLLIFNPNKGQNLFAYFGQTRQQLKSHETERRGECDCDDDPAGGMEPLKFSSNKLNQMEGYIL